MIQKGSLVTRDAPTDDAEWDAGVLMDDTTDTNEVRVYWIRAACTYTEDPGELEFLRFASNLAQFKGMP